MWGAGPLRALGWGDGDTLVGVGLHGKTGATSQLRGEGRLAPAVLEMGAVSSQPERKA